MSSAGSLPPDSGTEEFHIATSEVRDDLLRWSHQAHPMAGIEISSPLVQSVEGGKQSATGHVLNAATARNMIDYVLMKNQ